MTQYALYGSGLTAATNPDPSTLTTISPLPAGVMLYQGTANTAWTSQGKKALILPPEGNPYPAPQTCWLRFVPSQAGATFTVTLWRFAYIDSTTALWTPAFYQGSSNSYTGSTDDYIEGFDGTPLYFQINTLSGGSLKIYYDSQVAGVI